MPKIFPPLLVAAGTLVFSAAFAAAESYDLIVRNGRVIDGAGNPAFFADVAVKDGKVAAIGRRLAGAAGREYDAGGLIVAPGFIDVHTHAENIRRLRDAENFLRQGVTTLVLGNCGGSVTDVAGLFEDLANDPSSANVATLIGHNSIRRQVIGNVDREPTAAELAEMRALVDRAMRDGAAGFSTGLIYQPGSFSTTEEIVELAKAVTAYDGLYVSHMRSESLAIFEALDELFTIAREADIRAQVSHIKLSGNASWGQADEVLARIEAARAEGLDVTQDQYAYTAASTGLRQLIPSHAREGGRERFIERMADPEFKRSVMMEMAANIERNRRGDYTYAAIASYRANPSLNGLRIPEAAKRVRGSDSLEDQIELILEIEANGGGSGVFHGINADDMLTFMRHPNTMFASDSAIREFQAGVPHPRGYGNSARILARYVRENDILRIEEAVRRMTLLPAAVFRLENRGVIRPGAWADIIVFDPDIVQDHATFTEPHQYATGFRFVFVNGVLTVENDTHTGARAGMPVRRGE